MSPIWHGMKGKRKDVCPWSLSSLAQGYVMSCHMSVLGFVLQQYIQQCLRPNPNSPVFKHLLCASLSSMFHTYVMRIPQVRYYRSPFYTRGNRLGI